jgi:hypothetical protein
MSCCLLFLKCFHKLYESKVHSALETDSSIRFYIEDSLKFDSNLARNRQAGKWFKMVSLYPFIQIDPTRFIFIKVRLNETTFLSTSPNNLKCPRKEQCHSVLITADGRWAMCVGLTLPLPPSWSVLKGFQTTIGIPCQPQTTCYKCCWCAVIHCVVCSNWWTAFLELLENFQNIGVTGNVKIKG